MTFAPTNEERLCFVDCGKEAPECVCRQRYPYRHHGPAVYGSKMMDYLISEHHLREDRPELFDDSKERSDGA